MESRSAGSLVTIPALIIEGMVFRAGVRGAPPVAGQAGSRIVGFQVIGVSGNLGTLVGYGEDHQEHHQGEQGQEYDEDAPVQLRVTGARRAASWLSFASRRARWPASVSLKRAAHLAR